MTIYNNTDPVGRQNGLTTLTPGVSSGCGSQLGETLKQISSAYTDVLTLSDSIRSRVAALSLSDKMEMDNMSYIQTARGALSDIRSELERGRELAQKTADGEMSASSVQEELDRISANIDDIANNAKWNGQNIFDTQGPAVAENENVGYVSAAFGGSAESAADGDGTGEISFALVGQNGERINFSVEFLDDESEDAEYLDDVRFGAGGTTISWNSATAKQKAFATKLRDEVLPAIVSTIMSKLPLTSAYKDNSNVKIGLRLYKENSSTVAYVQSGGYTNNLGFQLGINLSSSALTISAAGDISLNGAAYAVMAHEMTHAIMFDMVSNGMFGSGGTAFPGWFVEGAAQCVGGAGPSLNWFSSCVGKSEAQLQSMMNGVNLNDGSGASHYRYGYIATAYLAYRAAGGTDADIATLSSSEMQSKIATGLDRIISSLADGYTFDSVIKAATKGAITSASAYANAFKTSSQNGNIAKFFKKLMDNSGTSGARSIITGSSMDASENSLVGITGSTSYFTLVVDKETVNSPSRMEGGTTNKAGKSLNGSKPADSDLPPRIWDGNDPDDVGNDTPATGTHTDPDDTGDLGDDLPPQGGDPKESKFAGGRLSMMTLQMGSRSKDAVAFLLGTAVKEGEVSAKGLQINKLSLADRESALSAVSAFDSAIDRISRMDSEFAALEARLGKYLNDSDGSGFEDIMDSDEAKALLSYTTSKILNNSQQAIAAQMEALGSSDDDTRNLVNE